MIVEVKNLNKRYGDKLAVDNMNINIKKGEILGLLGPNGAGKTTLINSIIGITEIQSGEINIFGKNMRKDSMEVKKNIGVVPQNIALLNEFTAIENVTYFARLYGLKGKELRESVQQALEFTNLWERRKDYPKKYSGGMQRRLNIACSIVHKPELIIMDEPTVGIDPQSRNHILESIKKLNKLGATIIYTSHYMEEVEAICTRVAIMDNGRLIAEGSKEELSQYILDDQVVEMVLSNPGYTIIEAVKNVSGVKECTLSANKLSLVLEKSCNISKVINTITNKDGIIVKINMEEATLEDVFLSLTGKKLRD
ncbi:MAG: ABC transporter ATP-binding protein [Clostridiaceae bacterium]|nr:ABC transporter ATP-binding protein [Clostridiaceae bacterium]